MRTSDIDYGDGIDLTLQDIDMNRIPLTDEDIYPYDTDVRINVGGRGADNHNRQIALKKQILDDYEFSSKTAFEWHDLTEKAEKWDALGNVKYQPNFDLIDVSEHKELKEKADLSGVLEKDIKFHKEKYAKMYLEYQQENKRLKADTHNMKVGRDMYHGMVQKVREWYNSIPQSEHSLPKLKEILGDEREGAKVYNDI